MAGRIKGITVEIGGDTTKLSTALKGVNSEIKGTQSQLRDVEKLLKLDPTNTELLAQKQRLLSDAISGTRTKLETLRTAASQANEQLARGDISREQYDALQREIIETEQSLSALESQARNTNVVMANISEASNKIGAFGEAATNAGTKMLPLTAAITAVGGASAKLAMDFEDAMAQVSTIADTAQVPLDDLEKSILELSNQTGISATEIAANVYDAISSGQQTGDAVNFVTNSTKLAKAGFADAGSALDVLTTIMNSYGLEASEVTNVSDTLIKTQDLGKTTVGELSASMGKIIPTAKANSVALDQVATGYAIMTSNGVATAESTTYMNSMLNELGKSGTKVSDTLKEKTGKSFAELMAEGKSLGDVLEIINGAAKEQGLAFTDLWGSSEASNAGLILLGDSAEEFNSTLSEMRDATGSTDAAFEKLQTNSNTINIAMNQLKNTAIELGNTIMSVLAPIIQSLAEKISSFSTWFSGLGEGTKTMILLIAGIVAAIGPVLIIIGQVATGISAIMSLVTVIGPALSGLIPIIASVGWPILAIVAAIVAVIAIGKLLITHWDEIKVACETIWNAIKDFFVAVWDGIKAVFQTVVEVIKTIVETYFNIYKTIIETVLNVIKAVFTTIWEAIKVVFTTVVEVIKTIVTTYFNNYKTIIETVLNVIKTVFETVWNAISTVVTTVVNTMKTFLTTAWNAIKMAITTVLNAIKTVVTTVWNRISSAVSTVVNGIKNTISTVWNTIKNTVTIVVNSIKSTVSNIFSSIWTGIKNTMSNIYNSIKSGFDKAVGFIKGLASSAYSWGTDIIDGLVKGIRNSIGKVGDAVKSVADKIWSFLHFSVPEEGPLTDYDSWMPDFMSGLAKGIERSRGLVASAVKGVAQEMVISPNLPTIKAQTSQTASLENLNSIMGNIRESIGTIHNRGANGDIVIPVYLGGTLIDEVVVNAQTRQNLRSGGR
ncbi:phage tail tape measure protein [Bacillus sp. APMAM]|nr:phage tail tape measure protein [Bacillus sp. APMAM]RTZ55562.1 phage tail tape measure protein [Bacillus sp. SAJ1]